MSAARRIVWQAADWHVRFLTSLVTRGYLDDDQADRLADVWDREHAPRLTEETHAGRVERGRGVPAPPPTDPVRGDALPGRA
jgi:hypothetical protein